MTKAPETTNPPSGTTGRTSTSTARILRILDAIRDVAYESMSAAAGNDTRKELAADKQDERRKTR